MAERKLNARQERFIVEYCVDWNGTRAAIAAGYSVKSAAESASENLRNSQVAEKIAQRKAVITSKVDLKVEDVVRSIASVIRADPRELTESKIGSCRHCWGAYHLYQYKPQEFRDAYAAWEKQERDPSKATNRPFDAKGGDGYRLKREPHEDCPECEGRGIEYTIVKDTGQLSADAAQLYMGVKQTANGVEVLTRSKDKAIEQAAKYLGMNKEQVLMGTAPLAPTLADFYGDAKK